MARRATSTQNDPKRAGQIKGYLKRMDRQFELTKKIQAKLEKDRDKASRSGYGRGG